MARDSINRNGIESPPVEFIVDSKYSTYVSHLCCTFVSLCFCPSFPHKAYLLPNLKNYNVQYNYYCVRQCAKTALKLYIAILFF